MAKTLAPTDLRDFLSILSFLGFVAIFFKFSLQNFFLSDIMDSLFLVIAGAGLMVVGKVFDIRKWARDGIQKNEIAQLFSVIFGLSSMIIGVLLFIGTQLPLQIQGFVGFLALAPAAFIFIDYLAKNN